MSITLRNTCSWPFIDYFYAVLFVIVSLGFENYEDVRFNDHVSLVPLRDKKKFDTVPTKQDLDERSLPRKSEAKYGKQVSARA